VATALERVVAALTKLPGIGQRTAQRLAFFILSMPQEEARALGEAILKLREEARFCQECFNIAEGQLCPICADQGRDRRLICVVEQPSDVMAIERSGVYRGLYHVLLGALSPVDGITPESLRLKELLHRVRADSVREVLLATNPNSKGEMTAQYIKEALRPYGVAVTRLAYGLPVGAELEYADVVTLRMALQGRRPLE
jgi:recombination protein RecR